MNGLRAIVAIAARELRSHRVSPLAWGAASGFLVLGGLAFFRRIVEFQDRLARYGVLAELSGREGLLALVNLNDVVVVGLARSLLLFCVFLAPLITLRAFAEDRATGMEEWLLTAPVSVPQIVLGKFVGNVAVAVAIVAASGVFPGILFRHGNPEVGPTWTAWLGLVLAMAALVAIGLAASACSRSQPFSATAALVIGLALHLLDAPARAAGPAVGAVLSAVSLPARFESFGKGLVVPGDVAYFVALVALALTVAGASLGSRRWS